MALPHKLRQSIMPLLGVISRPNISTVSDHETALRQLMERVVMSIDNAKFIKRSWVIIEWDQMHWVRPGPGGGVRVNQITPRLREAIRVALTARGYQVHTPPMRLGHRLQTTIRWGGY